MTIHEFTPPPPGATLYAADGGARYLRVDWIMRQELGSSPTYYCATDDWETTPAGRLAVKDREIAALHAHIAELERRLAEAAPSVPPTVAASATGMAPAIDAEGAARGNTGGADKRTPCPHCEKRLWPSLLAEHIAAHHAPARPPITLVEERGDWRCTLCLSSANTRDLHYPDYCINCAARTRAISSNGVSHG